MDDQATALGSLADDLKDRADVADAWTAESFTDRLFVVEVPTEEIARRRPAGVTRPRVARVQRGLRHRRPDADYAGRLADCRRYRFVGARERGELQSYVVE